MRKSSGLITAVVIVFLAIITLSSNSVFAGGNPFLEYLEDTRNILIGNRSYEKMMDGRYQIKQTASTTFPINIAQPGSYVLTSDITVTTNDTSCIEITADNVTLDLNGFSLIGAGPGNVGAHGIFMEERNNVEIRNGTVRNFGGNGICDAHSTLGTGHRIIAVRAIQNFTGIYLGKVGDGFQIVKNCTAVENTRTGIRTSRYAMIVGNVCSKNGGYGIYAGDGGGMIENNSLSYNLGGIKASTNATVRNNTLSMNRDSSIAINDKCLVKGNRIKASHIGIDVLYGKNVIEENFIADATTGIFFSQLGNFCNFYANNRLSGNTDDYNDTSGQTDGGGNVSF